MRCILWVSSTHYNIENSNSLHNLPFRLIHPRRKYKDTSRHNNSRRKSNHPIPILSSVGWMQNSSCNRRPRQTSTNQHPHCNVTCKMDIGDIRQWDKTSSHTHHSPDFSHILTYWRDSWILNTDHSTLKESKENCKDVESWNCHSKPCENGDTAQEGKWSDYIEPDLIRYSGFTIGSYGPNLSATKPGMIRPNAEEPLIMDNK